MADNTTLHPIYVDSTATGANDGSTKADAFTTLLPALTPGINATGTVIMSHLHFETPTNPDYDIANPISERSMPIISTDYATDLYRPSGILNISAIGNMDLREKMHFYGVGISCTARLFLQSGRGHTFITDGMLFIQYPGSGDFAQNADGGLILRNTHLHLGQLGIINSNASIFHTGGGFMHMQGGKVTGRAGFFNGLARAGGSTRSQAPSIFENVDMSELLLSAAPLFPYSLRDTPGLIRCLNCVMPDETVDEARLTDANALAYGYYVELINSSPAPNSQRGLYKRIYPNGAKIGTDNGVYLTVPGYRQQVTLAQQSHRMEMATTATSFVSQENPINGPWITRFKSLAETVTLTVEIEHDFTNPLTVSECYLDVKVLDGPALVIGELLTTNGAPVGFVANPVRSSVGAALETSTVDWTNQPPGRTKQKLTIPLTFAVAGAFSFRVVLATHEAGKTLRYDNAGSVA